MRLRSVLDFEQTRRTHAATDAHRHDAVLGFVTTPLDQDMRCQSVIDGVLLPIFSSLGSFVMVPAASYVCIRMLLFGCGSHRTLSCHHFSPNGRISCSNTQALRGC